MGKPYKYDFEKSLTKKIMGLLGIGLEEKDEKGFPKRSIKKLVLTMEAGMSPHIMVYVEEYLPSQVGQIEVSYTIPIQDDLEHCKLPEVGRAQG